MQIVNNRQLTIYNCYKLFVNQNDVTERQYQIHEKLLKVCQNGNPEEIVSAILDHYLFGLEKLIGKMKEQTSQETAADTLESA